MKQLACVFIVLGLSPICGWAQSSSAAAAAEAAVLQDWSAAVRQMREDARVRLNWLEAYIAQTDLAAAWKEQATLPEARPAFTGSSAYGVYERLRRSVFESLALPPHQITRLEAMDRSKADWTAMEQMEQRIALAESFLEKQGRFRESRQWIQTQVQGGAVQPGAAGPSVARMLAVLNAQRRRIGAENNVPAVLASASSAGPRVGSVTSNRISRPSQGLPGPSYSVVSPIFYSQLNQAAPGPNQAVTSIGVGSVFTMQPGGLQFSVTPPGWGGVGRVSR